MGVRLSENDVATAASGADTVSRDEVDIDERSPSGDVMSLLGRHCHLDQTRDGG